MFNNTPPFAFFSFFVEPKDTRRHDIPENIREEWWAGKVVKTYWCTTKLLNILHINNFNRCSLKTIYCKNRPNTVQLYLLWLVALKQTCHDLWDEKCDFSSHFLSFDGKMWFIWFMSYCWSDWWCKLQLINEFASDPGFFSQGHWEEMY